MALFGFGKKKENTRACTCSAGCSESEAAKTAGDCGADTKDGIWSIKVLGAGCKACHEQYEQAAAAVKNMGMEIEVEYLTDLQKVTAYGVMSMPAIIVNEKVVSIGRVLNAKEVEKLLHILGFQGSSD